MGKSTGQWVGAVVGAIAGFFTGGSTWYYTAASMLQGAAVGSAVGGAIDPPKGPNMVGPRLSDLNQQTSSYGVVVPRLYGAAALAGNIFWIENNALREVEANESQGGKGGGGATTTTYSYYATFALGLCQGPVEGIRRIWANGTLIYDVGAADYDTAVASTQLAAGIRFYPGSDTQMPDSRMQATLGVDDTPAFRGLCYLVFDDFALKNYGNTLMGVQFKVEVVKDASYAGTMLSAEGFPTISGYTSADGQATMQAIRGRSTSTRWTSGSYTDALLINVIEPGSPVPTVFDVSPTPGSHTSLTRVWARLDTILCGVGLGGRGNGTATLFQYTFDGTTWLEQTWTGWSNDAVQAVCEVDGYVLYVMWGAAGGLSNIRVVGSDGFTHVLPTMPDKAVIVAHAGSSDQFVVAYSSGAVWKYDLGVMTSTTVSLPASAVNELHDIYIENGIVYRFWATASKTLRAWDSFDFSTLAAIGSGTATCPVASASFTFNFHGYPADYIDGDIWTWVQAVIPNNDYGNVQGAAVVTTLMNRMTPLPVALSDIVRDECVQSEVLTIDDLDLATMGDSVRGYRVGSLGAVRAAIEPLQSIWPFDVIQSGYKIRFKRRATSASVVTIPESDLAARPYKDKPEQRVTQSHEMNTQLPYRVSVKHLDIDREYDIGEQYAERLNTGSVNQVALEPAVVLSAQETARAAEVLLNLYWMERDNLSFSLPPPYAYLEPGDIVTLTYDGELFDVRLTDIDQESTGVIRCAARPHFAETYVSTALADGGLTAASGIALQGGTNFELLDIPVVVDDIDAPGYIAAIGRYKSAWPGGNLFKSIDAGQSYNSAAASALPTPIGYATTAIAAPASFALIDTASVLGAQFFAETMASVSEAQMLAGDNHFAFGKDGRWEIIAAQNIVLQGDGTWLLTNLLRGRFGTEAHAGLHVVGDKLVQLSRTRLQFIPAGLSQIGVAALFKAATFGASLDDYPGRSFAYRGVNLKPLAPVWLNGDRHPSTNDWSLTWLRRGRIGGEWRDGVDVPLGEAREAYEIDIYSSGAYTTLKRTITAASAAAAYTSAQQVADFGSNQSTLYVKVYQMSDAVGRGTPLTTSITR